MRPLDKSVDRFSVPTLATDLDGTFLPRQHGGSGSLDAIALQSVRQLVNEARLRLIFVTGRHIESVKSAIQIYGLPEPEWVISDVGSSIYFRQPDTAVGSFYPVSLYTSHLTQILGGRAVQDYRDCFDGISGLVLQEEEKQRPFKLSFYFDPDRSDAIIGQIERQLQSLQCSLNLIHSLDPEDGRGLLDLVPRGVHKGFALSWLIEHTQRKGLPGQESQEELNQGEIEKNARSFTGAGISTDSLAFAGDSGNDFAALTAEFKAILVGNAPRDLANRILEFHRSAGTDHKVYFSRNFQTAGVWEGLQHFGLVPPKESL